MTSAIHTPAPPLNRYIECLWYVDLQVPYQRERILPTGTVELILNFGGSFRLYDRDDPAQYTLQTDGWLVGLQTAYLLNEPQAESHMIGVRFRPGGAYPFLRLPASELHNQVIPAELLWGRLAQEWRERLHEQPTPAARFALLEHLLRQQLDDRPPDLQRIEVAVQQLARSGGVLSIQHLSDQIGISQKHLITQFKRVVGVSPKALARIYRFQQALNTINPTHSTDWAQVAHAAHYYDQAHFNKDFAAFTGMTPTDYLRLRRAAFGETLSQGEDVHFVPVG